MMTKRPLLYIWFYFFLLAFAGYALSIIFIDIPHLTSLYTPVCGPKGLCLPHSFLNSHLPLVNSSCKSCSCNPYCMFSLTPCCYQSFLLTPNVHCRDFALLSKTFTTQSFNYVVDVCPPIADRELAENCSREYNMIERMKTPPVVDPETQISYKNRFCAACYDIHRTESWNLEFNCLKHQDFNYLSSYEEILRAAREAKCNILHVSQSSFNCGIENNIVAKCNISGTWNNYDSDIEKACHSDYILEYQMYKNIFCAMCNPPVPSSKLQKKTCLYNPQNNINRACFSQPETMLSYPYRNVFCKHYIDQTGTRESRKLTQYTSRYLRNVSNPFEYKIIVRLRFETLLDNIENARKLEVIRFRPSLSDRLQINITNLMQVSFAAFGEKRCDSNAFSSIFQHSKESCSCHIGCTTNCCDDLALRQPLSCINDAFPPQTTENSGYYVLNECPKTDKALYSLCTSTNIEDDISLQLPVTHSAFGKYVSYRNVYCMIGNLNTSIVSQYELQNEISYNTDSWIVRILCSIPVTLDWVNVTSFIQYTKDVNCKHSLYPHEKTIVCEDKTVDVDTCNETGAWQSFDSDVLIACQDLEKFRLPILYDKTLNISYSNKFCKICNPYYVPSNETSIAECDSHLAADSNISDICHSLPDVHVCSQYKNIACEICNGDLGCEFEYSKVKKIEYEYVFPDSNSYRSMFALSSFDSTHIISKECSQIEVSLQGTCRRIECFPGKIYNQNACVPIFNSASNLRYGMYVKMDITLKQPMFNRDVLNLVEMWIYTKIANILRIDQWLIQFENSTFLNWKSCNTKATSFSISSRVTFYLHSTLGNRLEVEVGLTEFTKSVYQTTLSDFYAVIQTYPSPKLESVIENHDNDVGVCRRFSAVYNTTSMHFKLALINDLLLCKLVTLTHDEFVVESIDRIRLVPSNRLLSFQQFRVSDDGNYQTCIENMKSYFVEENSYIQNPLPAVTGICSIISIVCLFLTFGTYCLFESLRTIPGVNSMYLMATLFFLQLLVLTRNFYIIAPTVPRILLFALTHYMVLCVFFWLKTCSYHMFCVFVKQSNSVSRRDGRRTLSNYCIYSYGMPLLIIVGNVCFSLISSSGQEFGYGRQNTLTDDKMAYIVTFITPLSVICLTNSFFFFTTAYRIKSTPKVKGLDQSRLHFVVCLKLFFLTGLTWGFQIIDSFLELSVLSYIVAVLNGLQGFFLFLSYVCNTRVWKMYKELLESSLKWVPTGSSHLS